MKRRHVVVVLVVLVLGALAAYVVWPRSPYPCRATFEQVREGMTYEEACATVGGPPGDYTDGRSLEYLDSQVYFGNPRPKTVVWATEDSALWVDFGPDRRAVEVRVGDSNLFPAPSLWDRLRDRLGL